MIPHEGLCPPLEDYRESRRLFREAAPGKAHTTGELARRYVVKIKGKETYLYETGGRWFVEMKA